MHGGVGSAGGPGGAGALAGADPGSTAARAPGVLNALSEGLRDLVWRRKLWPGLYLIGLAASLLVVLPLFGALSAELGPRPEWAGRLAGGDLTVLDELQGRLRLVRAGLPLLLVAALAGVYLLRVFMLGGILEALRHGRQRCLGLRELADAAVTRFGAMASLAVVFLLLHAAAFGLVAGGLKLAAKVTEGRLWPMAPQVGALVGALPGALALLVLATAHDYARVALVLGVGGRRPPALRQALGGLVFVARHPGSLGLHLVSMLLGVIVWLVCVALCAPLPGVGLGAITVVGLQQLTSFTRTGIHLARYRSAIVYFEPRAGVLPGTAAPAEPPQASACAATEAPTEYVTM